MAVKWRLIDTKPKWGYGFCISGVHIYAMFKEALLNTSSVISKTSFEQRGMFPQDNQQFGQKNQDIIATGTHCTKGCKGCAGTFKTYGTFWLNFAASVGHSHVVSLGNLG